MAKLWVFSFFVGVYEAIFNATILDQHYAVLSAGRATVEAEYTSIDGVLGYAFRARYGSLYYVDYYTGE